MTVGFASRMAGDDPPALRLLQGLQPLLGARTDATRSYANGAVTYRRFSMEGSPLSALVHPLAVLLTHQDAPAMIRTLAALLGP